MSVKHTVENVYLRQEAVQKTRKHFWRLLGMLAVIALCTWLMENGLTALGDMITAPETQAIVDAANTFVTSKTITSTAPMTDALSSLFTSAKFWAFNLAYIAIAGLVSNGLSLGRHAQLLAVAARDEKPRLLGGFCRMRYCLKAWGLSLFVALKTALWALPGALVFFLSVELQDLGQYDLGNVIGCIGVGLLFGLIIPAALRYCLSTFIMANEPERGVRECVTLSKGLMQGRKWQCFKLGVPMILKMIGVMYGTIILLSMVLAIIGNNASVAVQVIFLITILLAIFLPSIYFGIQFDVVYALFFLKCREPAADAPVSYWLRDHTETDPAKAAPISAWQESNPPSPAQEESPDAPAESPDASPEDISPETNEEKENEQ